MVRTIKYKKKLLRRSKSKHSAKRIRTIIWRGFYKKKNM